MIDLSGLWEMADAGGEYRCPVRLPGDGITALHDAGLIADPYWGRNEYDLRWIAERDWTASRNITLDDPNVDLVLSAVDTVVSILWNGQEVANTCNSFRTYRVPLTGVATKGENTVQIVFRSSMVKAAELQKQQPFYVPSMHDNPNMKLMCPIPNGNMLRKVACDYGWDWNIALAPFGLYGDLRLEPAKAPRIDRVMVHQEHKDGTAILHVSATTTNHTGHIRYTFGGQTLETNGPVSFTIENPDLWWPAGLGKQPLYDLTVTAGTATAHRKIGLRKMELVTEKDEAGLGFKFRVNGHDTFAKGANWIPADALAGRITPEKTRELLQSAVDANMNMIRIWGGGRYEPTWFYDLCDELGLMVWQDFMFACNLYPSTPDYLAEVKAEVRDNVDRMHHHACLAVWCGDNELIGALGWFPESRKDRDRYLVNYDRLNRAIEESLKETDPHAIWWPSSPSPGPMNFGDAWHDDGSGDMHFWSVWHESKDFDYYRTVSPRFCSEFGFQSYPSLSTIRTFADEADWNIASPIFESHQKNDGGNERIAGTMFRYFRWPEKFEDFVWLSQIQQGLAIKTAVTHWRSLKPHCMGTLVWQLNDTWPVCSWASLDYGGNWKMLHYMEQRFFAPVTVVCVPETDSYVLKAINDHREGVDLTVTARAVDMQGNLRDLGQGKVAVGTTSIEALRIAKDAVRKDEMIAFVWEASDGTRSGDVFAPQAYKSYDLRDSALKVDQNGNSLTISADNLALFVTVEADVPGRFSTNAFTVFPGIPATVTFTPRDPKAVAKFTVRDLYTATVARHL